MEQDGSKGSAEIPEKQSIPGENGNGGSSENAPLLSHTQEVNAENAAETAEKTAEKDEGAVTEVFEKNEGAAAETAESGAADAAPPAQTGQASNKKEMRKFWIKIAFLFVLIGISIVLLFTITDSLTDDSIKSFPALIAGINVDWLLILLGVVVLCIVFDSAKYAYLLKISTGKLHFRASVKVMFLGKYYDGITPLGTGGQPFQIHYLHKKNSIPAGVATAVPLVLFTVSTVVFCIFATVLFCITPGYVSAGNAGIVTPMRAIAWVSMILNFLIPVAIITVSLFPNFGKRAVMWIIKLLAKLRIVKNPYRVAIKFVREVIEYRSSLKSILSRWWHFIPLALLSFGSAVLGMGVPFFVMMALADIAPTFDVFVQILCMSMLTFYAASMVPTPGNSGALETAASLIFATVLGASAGGTIGWSILLWRLLTYYIYIIIGVGINIFEIIRSAVRNHRKSLAQAPPK